MKMAFWRGGNTSARSARKRHTQTLSLQTLENREVPALNPTGAEQEMLELVNHMRTDPQGHFSRLVNPSNPSTSPDPGVNSAMDYFNVNGTMLRSQWNALTAAQPLAWNESMMTAAGNHNNAMIAADQQSHQLPGEAGVGARLTSAGYSWNAYAENIFAFSESAFFGHAGFAIDWGGSAATGGMQSPAGHRNNIMSGSYREIGIRVTNETNPGTSVGPQVITQDFGNRSGLSGGGYLLGVVYNDANSNTFYNAGEGLGNVTIQVTGAGGFNRTLTSMTAGGYQTFLNAGVYTVTFSGGGLASPVTRNVTVGSANVKVDVTSGSTSEPPTPPVTPNTAPVLNITPVQTLAPIATNNGNPTGTAVSSLIAGLATDANAGNTVGIAVTAATATGGAWQYSTDNGGTWTSFGTVTAATARLLAPTAQVRFLPNVGFAGTATLSYKAWDGTAGTAGSTASAAATGGATAFSTATESVTVRVQTAPNLDTTRLGVFPNVAEDNRSPVGVSVGALLKQGFSDPNSSTNNGIALTSLSNGSDGSWQYRVSGTTAWKVIGDVSPSSALLLRGPDYLRFVPKANFNGTVTIGFRAWDRSQGATAARWDVSADARVGGGTAFSAQQATMNHWVVPVNDSPILNTAPSPTLPRVTGPAGSVTQSTIASLLGGSVTDNDPGALSGIAMVSVTKNAAYVWEYSIDGGATWASLSSVSATAARLLRSTDLIRVRTLTAIATPLAARIVFRAWDQTQGTAGGTWNVSTSASIGGRTAFSSAGEAATTTVG